MSDVVRKTKALMFRIYEEMWNKANPGIAGELFTHPEAVEKFVREFLQIFPDLQHTVEGLIVEGDRAAVRFSARGTHAGPWLSFAPTGKSIYYTGVTWARIAEDRIVEHYTWWDKASLLEQLQQR